MTVSTKIGEFAVGGGNRLALIAGPCVIESEKIVFDTCEKIKEVTFRHKIPFIFKSSYSKANRLNINSYSGPGLRDGLKILKKVKKEFEVPILTDIHNPAEALPVSEVADVLQIPAFLCRQTDLILTAAKTGKPLNIKKGQFMAPEDMLPIAQKAESVGNKKILLTERGSFFGYHNLVVDLRSLLIMRNLGYPVVFDATHSLQLPGSQGNYSGGQPQFILPLARAAVACGCDALFVETHPDVKNALCDKDNMLPLDRLEEFLFQVQAIDQAIR
ncbi:MAG: 2-dehydro-3-deoxyphosphooctonate aldolase [candidate division Zixibacteria bacterium SM23_73_3]|nr:MAG: 2-dehydro-3-deoxyphosphooctonate aldolase [candidate division Zixibacteria bacterium SM23_73_3]